MKIRGVDTIITIWTTRRLKGNVTSRELKVHILKRFQCRCISGAEATPG